MNSFLLVILAIIIYIAVWILSPYISMILFNIFIILVNGIQYMGKQFLNLFRIIKKHKIISTFVLCITFAVVIIFTCNLNYKSDSYNYYMDDNRVELVYLTEFVLPGETASIEVKSEPNTEHEIIVTYSSGASTAEGLDNKFSDDNGYVEWSWKVGTNTNEGTYPIEIYNLDTFESETFYFTIE